MCAGVPAGEKIEAGTSARNAWLVRQPERGEAGGKGSGQTTTPGGGVWVIPKITKAKRLNNHFVVSCSDGSSASQCARMSHSVVVIANSLAVPPAGNPEQTRGQRRGHFGRNAGKRKQKKKGNFSVITHHMDTCKSFHKCERGTTMAKRGGAMHRKSNLGP